MSTGLEFEPGHAERARDERRREGIARPVDRRLLDDVLGDRTPHHAHLRRVPLIRGMVIHTGRIGCCLSVALGLREEDVKLLESLFFVVECDC